MAVTGHVARVRLQGREAARTRRLALSEALQDLELFEEQAPAAVSLTYDELNDYRSLTKSLVPYWDTKNQDRHQQKKKTKMKKKKTKETVASVKLTGADEGRACPSINFNSIISENPAARGGTRGKPKHQRGPVSQSLLHGWEAEFPWMAFLGRDDCGFPLVHCRLCLQHAPKSSKFADEDGKGAVCRGRDMFIRHAKRQPHKKSEGMAQLQAELQGASLS